jgi:hypothetical protein
MHEVLLLLLLLLLLLSALPLRLLLRFSRPASSHLQ